MLKPIINIRLKRRLTRFDIQMIENKATSCCKYNNKKNVKIWVTNFGKRY